MIRPNYKIIALGDINLYELRPPKTAKISRQKNIIIEKIWQNALRKKGGELFNGTMLSFTTADVTGNKINIGGNFIEYKNFLASRKQTSLKLNIKPVGVSGMIVIKEGRVNYTVLAKRTAAVTDHQNFFELVPSGGIDKEFLRDNGNIDYQSKLISELSEETGLPKSCVKKISSFALVLDKSKNIYDICCVISIRKNRRATAECFTKSSEYKNPQFVPLKDLTAFIKVKSGSIVPTSIALLKAYAQFNKG